jgi:predicted RNA-binding Zn-ribbon protein involved in translation (DUF1610 family)
MLTFACPKCGERYIVALYHWRMGYGQYCSLFCRFAMKEEES